jgi:ketosteroid isomerase-like protein
MRIRLASTLGLVLFGCLTPRLAAQQPADPSAQVRKLEEKWTEAYKVRDIDILSTLLAEDFVITVEDGNIYSKAGYITHSADPTVHVEVAELSDLHVRVRGGGNIAVVTGAYHERGKSNGKPYEYHDRLTDVWVKVGNNWRVLASHYAVPTK